MSNGRSILAFVILGFALLRAACFPAEVPSSLFVTGDIREVQLDRHPPSNWVVVYLSMTMHFENRGSTPLLLFVDDGWPWQGGRTLAVSRKEALSKKYVYVSGVWPASARPSWVETHRRLDQKFPPADLIRSIAPGSEWSFDQTIVLGVEIKGSFDKTSKPWDLIKEIDPLWLQLTFGLWPNNLEQNMLKPQFGRRLQRRCKEWGHLVIDYAVSEPIPFSLPASSEPAGPIR